MSIIVLQKTTSSKKGARRGLTNASDHRADWDISYTVFSTATGHPLSRFNEASSLACSHLLTDLPLTISVESVVDWQFNFQDLVVILQSKMTEAFGDGLQPWSFRPPV